MIVRCASILIVATALSPAVADGLQDHELIAQVAAERQTVDSQQKPPAEPQTRVYGVLDQVRVELVQARQALAARRFVDAARQAQDVLVLLKQLPADMDISVYELQAEGILAKAERAGVAVDRIPATAPESTEQQQFAAAMARLDDQARAAAEIARQYTGADTGDIDTRGDAEALQERALWNQMPDEQGYRPAKEIIDVQSLLRRDRQRLYYQDALRQAYKADEARVLVEADEARVAPTGVVSYPDDWPQIVAKRAKYKDGVIARSPSWVDSDGREWYVALYEIRDLVFVPPDFDRAMGAGPVEQMRNALDRDALRWRSEIFGGYADDLAAGIPLLRYFGGIDEGVQSRYSPERQQHVVDIIRAFVGPRTAEPTLQPIGP